MAEIKMQDITYALAASPGFVQDGTCFAARGGGLFRSQDGGKTWLSAYETLGLEIPLATMTVVLSPGFPSDAAVYAGVQGGILRSFDGGTHWHIATLPSPPPIVSAMVISPNYVHDGTLLAGTLEDGVFRSADRGSNWAAWNFGLLDLSVLCLAISEGFAQDETLFAGTETGVFRSTNGGRAWRETAFPTEFGPVLSLALSPGYAEDGTLFAGTEANGLFRSPDRGSSWERLAEDVIDDAVNGIVLSPQSSQVPQLLVVLGDALLVSRDGGETWKDWSPGLDLDRGTICAMAPLGLDSGAPLLVGMAEGGVLSV
jgi:photosystem II stability/assembly factor-like uncharacterized protein